MKLLGVPVRPRASYLLLGVVAAAFMRTALLRDVAGISQVAADLLAGVVGLSLLVSVLLHELAHAATALRLGLPVARIDLTFWGGATEIDEPRTAREQYLVSITGPVVNVLIAGVAAAVLLASDAHPLVHEVAASITLVNVLLASYNLLPGLPLDGGQLVRAAVWGATGDKITGLRAAGIGGLVTAGATVLLGLSLIGTSYVSGLSTVFVGLLVARQAQGALLGASTARRLPSVIAGRLARPAFVAQADLPLAEALRRAAERGLTSVVLGVDGRPSAVMSDALLAAVPEARRPWVSLSTVTEVVTDSLDAGLTGEDLLAAMREHPATAYVVTSQGSLVGVLTMADVARSLRGASA